MNTLLLFALGALATPPETASVVGGSPASPGEWPDAVAIYQNETPFCTGVLVAPDLVVTAGHCTGNVHSVRVGTHDLTTGEGETRDIVETWVYPNYITTLDIMLVRLSAPVDTLPRTLALDCIEDLYLVDDARVSVVGYGATDLNGLNFPDVLMTAETTIVDATCSTAGRDCNEAVIPFGELIAGGEGVDSCVGDSGGPLYIHTDEGDYLAGVTSRGIKPSSTSCGDGGIYVRADAFALWIEDEADVVLPRPDCDSLGLNQAPEPTAELLLALGGSGSVQIFANDPNASDTHSYTVLADPLAGTITVDDTGLVTYTTSTEETETDLFTIQVTDSGTPPLSSELVIHVQVEPAPFEDPGGFACAQTQWKSMISWLWLGIPWLLCHHRRRTRRESAC